ncbi:hypothetical protein [Chryseobacterium balustinum]|uniref:Uncharacterized protein n=1 Tax=Chryseobacterium balustinum TaxID=246 RepID=A0ABY1LCM9_9FLAO|nr:hypothetical protein [Chryseobacterium balustinum]AZB32128.1 hypothetical protein EB354_22880 [Chryseobacterium balustinum]SKB93931.1 hypothetical protein SAMN05421800_11553 [Chryseobacterium balustinum]
MEKNSEIFKKIVVSEMTHINLTNLKKIYKITSMDRLINELISYRNNDSKKFGFDNDSLKKDMVDFKGKLDARIDGVYKRLGKYNDLYFGKIIDVNDKMDELFKLLHKPEKVIETKIISDVETKQKTENIVDLKLQKDFEKLTASHEILELENEKLQQRINLLQSKFQSNKNPFSSKFEASLSKGEFDNIFG